MKQRFKAILDSWVTSAMGIVVYVITTAFIIKGRFDFWPEGTAGYVVGTVLLMFPKSIETFILAYFNSKNQSNGECGPNDPKPE